MSDKEKWLDGELWNFVRGAAIDLEIPPNSPREEELYRNMKQVCEVYARLVAVECRAPAPQPAGEHVCQTPNYTDGPCYACAKDMLMEWVFERYENCVRISDGKTGEDRAGWLQDADHFMLILSLLRGAATPQVTPWKSRFADSDVTGDIHNYVDTGDGKRLWAQDAAEIVKRHNEGTSEQAPQVTPELEIEKESDGRWIAEFNRFPGVIAYGPTPEEAIRNAAKVLIQPDVASEQASPTPDKCPTCGSEPMRSSSLSYWVRPRE